MSVLEVAEQTAEVGSARRVSLGSRVVATLESARSLLNTDRIPDEDLQRIREGDRHVALRQVEQTTAAAVSSLAAGPSRTVRVLTVQQLLADVHSSVGKGCSARPPARREAFPWTRYAAAISSWCASTCPA
jgi:hypothetical protein